jgi:hypothetical protein
MKSSPEPSSAILVEHIILKAVLTSTGTALIGVSSPICCTKYCSTKLNISGPLILVLIIVSIAVDLPWLDVIMRIIGGLELELLGLLLLLANKVASTTLSALTCGSSSEVASATAAAAGTLTAFFLDEARFMV